MAEKIIADRDLILTLIERIRASVAPGSGISMEEYDFLKNNCKDLHEYIVMCPKADNQASYPSIRVRRGR